MCEREAPSPESSCNSPLSAKPQSDKAEVPPNRKMAALYSVAIVLVIAVWWTVLNDPAYQDAFRGIFGTRPVRAARPDYAMYEAKDPPNGTPLPAVGVGASIRKKTPYNKNGYLLAAVGDCEGCTQLNLPKLFSQTKERHISLVAFAYGDEERVRQSAISHRRDGREIPYFYDGDKKLSERLNSYYAGRLYYFTGDWKLRWAELDGQVDNYLFSTGRFDRIMENTE